MKLPPIFVCLLGLCNFNRAPFSCYILCSVVVRSTGRLLLLLLFLFPLLEISDQGNRLNTTHMKITTASNYTRAHDWCLWRHLVNLIVALEVRRQGVWLSGACSVLISSKNVEASLWLYG